MQTKSTIKTLIVDDEPLARKRIRDLLSNEPDVSIVGECGDGLDAQTKVRALSPDLLFLDIKMPGLSGLQLAHTLSRDKHVPYIIFTTAYGEHAIDAFEVEALDYLMKPFDRQRFHLALMRARHRIASGTAHLSDMEHMVKQLSGLMANLPSHPNSRLAVKDGSHIKFFVLSEITHLLSDGDYLNIHTVDGGHTMVRARMHEMQEQLPEPSFVRISRSALINFEHVMEIKPTSHGDYEFLLPGGERLASGKTYRESIRIVLARLKNTR